MAAVPPNLKGINSFIKLAKEYDKRDATVAYFCRMYAVQKGIKLDSKSPDCKMFLIKLMDQLEEVKKALIASGDEAVSNDIVAQAHIETKTINLFTWADTEDRNGVFNKNITKAFYSTSLLFEVLTQFGEQNDECKVMQKYSKWKATYLHRCTQSGETPIPGPEGSGFEDDLGALTADLANLPQLPGSDLPVDASAQPPQPPPQQQYPPPQQQYPPPQQQYPPPQDSPGSSRQPDAFSPPPQQQASPRRAYAVDVSQVDMEQAQKHCKFALSALEYEDISSAVDNLTKALNLLTKR